MAEEETEPGIETEDLVGKVLSGRFRVLETIGQGGAGRVFLGVQEPLGRMVAIKVLRDDLKGQAREEFSARFEREAAVAGKLNHPNVVTVHDYGTTDRGLRYVVMERLTGKPLSTLVKGVALKPHRAARLIADLAKGLGAAHDAGLIHRDVKPHNVIVQEEDGRERPVLLDFGLVKVLRNAGDDAEDSDAYSTRAGTYMGTPAYMAPEQAKGEAMDHRVDIYALGCMLYRLLTGRTPYTADHPLGLAVQHMTEPFPPMAERAPDVVVPAPLERITERCMAKSPADRYPDCRAVVAELEAWLGEAPVVLGTDPPTASRSGVAVGAGVGAFGASLGLLGVGVGLVAVLVAIGVVWTVQPGDSDADDTLEPARLLDPIEPTEPSEPVPTEPADPADPAPADPAPTEPAPAEPSDPAPTEPAAPLPMPVPTVDPLPRPDPPPDPRPEPRPDPAPLTRPTPPPGALVFDDVVFTAAEADAALSFVNSADAAGLRKAGVYNRGVELILAERPFASMEAFAKTRGIGTKTVEAAKRGGK